MLVVRKQGKAHNQYNSFRSAFELLESVGREPHDGFEETNEDLPPLVRLEQRMQQQIDELKTENVKAHAKAHHTRQQMQQQIDELKAQNKTLQSRLETKHDPIADELLTSVI